MRFPEFSEEWSLNLLNKFAKNITKKNKGNQITNVLSNSANYGIIQQSDFFDRSIANTENTEGYYVISHDDFVYNPRKSTAAPYGPINIYEGEKEGIISPLYLCFKTKGINKKFLYHFFKSPKWYPYMYVNGDSGVRHDRVSIKDETFLELPIKYPSPREQEKIAVFLDAIDVRIATQIRIIEDLKSLSDVICQRLYAPTGDKKWQTYKYADLFSVSNERNSKLQYSNVLSASQEYGMVERNELNIDIKFDTSSIINYKIVRPDEYVIHLRSFQGGFAYSDKTGVCSPAYTILVPNEKLSTAFLKYYFTSKKFIDSLRIVTYGIRDGRSINVEEFLQLKVAIPPIPHQQHIAKVMQLWEEKIRTEESYLTKLQQQKQYLLAEMFV